MKISKLFHWLYAILMLFPVIAIGSTILLNTFQTTEQKEINTTYDYQTNEVNSIEDFVRGNIYHFHYEKLDYDTEYICRCQAIFLTEDNVTNAKYLIEKSKSFFEIRLSGTNWQLDVFTYNKANSVGRTTFISRNIDFDFVYEDNTYIDFNKYEYSKSENTHIIEYTESGINRSDIFYYSINQVEQSSIFNWAMSSFLVTPFSYIVGLFGMPSNNIVVLLLSYWLDISIIWLVFDLIMYVPLLVHRWIDKAGIE